jgi:hypothetical protein
VPGDGSRDDVATEDDDEGTRTTAEDELLTLTDDGSTDVDTGDDALEEIVADGGSAGAEDEYCALDEAGSDDDVARDVEEGYCGLEDRLLSDGTAVLLK